MGAVRSGVDSGLWTLERRSLEAPVVRERTRWDGIVGYRWEISQNNGTKKLGFFRTKYAGVRFDINLEELENRQLGASTSSTTLEETTQPGFGPGLCPHSKNLVSRARRATAQDLRCYRRNRLEAGEPAAIDSASRPCRSGQRIAGLYCVQLHYREHTHTRYRHGRSIAGPPSRQ